MPNSRITSCGACGLAENAAAASRVNPSTTGRTTRQAMAMEPGHGT